MQKFYWLNSPVYLIVKSKLSRVLSQLNPIHKKEPSVFFYIQYKWDLKIAVKTNFRVLLSKTSYTA